MTTPLYGLILAGGRSTRMGEDKATLAYHGATQLDWAMALVKPFVERAYVSVRPDQIDEPVRARYPQIVDVHRDLGPIAGLIAAQTQHPDVAWLVLACDLPFLDAGTLHRLIAARAPHRAATAYRSRHDALPEPLCAIYEPASRELIATYAASGKHCPRKFLIQSDAYLLDQPNPQALENINTPEEHGAALGDLSPKTVTVQYFALLRDQARKREETLETRARNPADLYAELKQRHAFTLDTNALRVAVNTEFSAWDRPLRGGDSVVFIPPVAGG